MRVRGLKRLVAIWLLVVMTSHPMRVRGLKRLGNLVIVSTSQVAPHAGAWIETEIITVLFVAVVGSHPMRVRGLKQVICIYVLLVVLRRTPCGCVD